MMEFTNDTLGVSFSLPDEPTVRQQLAYRSRIFGAIGADVFARHWDGALELIEDWECEDIPDPKALDLDKETSRRVADIVMWAGNQVASHVYRIEDVDPN